MPERKKQTKTSERLGRMLAIVPYFVQHPGTQLTEAARLFDVPAKELERDLMLLFMSGLPPYEPGDLIDVLVDEGRVWINMADHFSRPLRLSRSEALALYLRGTELLATPGLPEAPALRAALDKLREGLGEETLGQTTGRIETVEAGRPAQLLEELRAAARGRERLEIDYFAASSGEWSTRVIDPEEVFSSLGNWYVAAWDITVGDERLFRADRIARADRTGERFERRGLAGAGRALYTPSDADMPVRLRLSPAARWVGEYYAVEEVSEAPNGGVDVTLPTGRLDWLAGLLLRLGPEAQVLDPPELAQRVRDLAARTLENYRD